MKFIISTLALTQGAAINPVPVDNTYLDGSNLDWDFANPATSVATAPTDVSEKNTFNTAVGTSGGVSSGLYRCIRNGYLAVEQADYVYKDTSGTTAEPLLVFSGVTDGDNNWVQNVSGAPASVEEQTGSAAITFASDVTSGKFQVLDNVGVTVAADTTISDVYDCCPNADLGTLAGVALCPTLVSYYQSTTANEVASITASDATAATNVVDAASGDDRYYLPDAIQHGGSADIDNSASVNTDFYLASLGQQLTDSTATNNYCNVSSIANAFVVPASTDDTVISLGNASAQNSGAKCTFQLFSTGDNAPTIGLKGTPTDNIAIQYVEWSHNSASVSDMNALLLTNHAADDDADPQPAFLFDPYSSSANPEAASDFTHVSVTDNFPGSIAQDFTVRLQTVYEDFDTDSNIDYLLTWGTAGAGLPEFTVNSALIINWFDQISSLSTQYSSQLSSYNTDAEEWNDAVKLITDERAEGKAPEEQTELPEERPCPPTMQKYPVSDFFLNQEFLAANDNDFENSSIELTIESQSDSDITNTYSIGTLATERAAGESGEAWPNHVFGRLGQGADTPTWAYRAFIVDAETDSTQWMMVSILPSDDSDSLLAANAKVEVDVGEVPLGFFELPSAASGKATSLDELEAASTLAMSAVAMLAVAASLY